MVVAFKVGVAVAVARVDRNGTTGLAQALAPEDTAVCALAVAVAERCAVAVINLALHAVDTAVSRESALFVEVAPADIEVRLEQE